MDRPGAHTQSSPFSNQILSTADIKSDVLFTPIPFPRTADSFSLGFDDEFDDIAKSKTDGKRSTSCRFLLPIEKKVKATNRSSQGKSDSSCNKSELSF